MSTADMISIGIAAVVYTAMVAVCFLIGSKWSRGNWLNLIAGYNTEPGFEKDKYDTDGLAKFMSIVAYVNGGLFIVLVPVVYLAVKTHYYWLIYFLIFDLVAFDIFGAIHSRKFKVNAKA